MDINFILGDGEKSIYDMEDNKYDLAFLDPVYGIDGNSHRKNESRGKLSKSKKYDSEIWDQKPPSPEFFREIKRVSKYHIIWGINYFNNEYLTDPGRIVWDKVNGSTSFSDAEIEGTNLFDSTRVVHYMWSGMMQGRTIGRSSSVMQGNKDLNEFRIHACQKPVILYRYILEKFCKKGWNVLDTHTGSGSNAIACDIEGFNLDSYEIVPKTHKDAVDRFNEHKEGKTPPPLLDEKYHQSDMFNE